MDYYLYHYAFNVIFRSVLLVIVIWQVLLDRDGPQFHNDTDFLSDCWRKLPESWLQILEQVRWVSCSWIGQIWQIWLREEIEFYIFVTTRKKKTKQNKTKQNKTKQNKTTTTTTTKTTMIGQLRMSIASEGHVSVEKALGFNDRPDQFKPIRPSLV